ncbi:dna rna polymerases superfamily protein [Cystoisospora suis]|uniref:Dna rna polymerases superfamily protein n=1 Tax=Cystoisospora suis TaxID=483139 RepID=A0A2C6L3W0_9APIC|nr:dna rna polymerases superfamily protein [Cystoisospora suis]
MKWDTPLTDKHQVKRFYGLASYYRMFVPQFASIALPLTRLLRKDALFSWGPDEQGAVDRLRELLCRPPVLALPDFHKVFILYTDASDGALGAVLAQEYQGRERPIAFLSRALTAQERNYPVRDKELLSVVWAIKQLHSYLRCAPFILRTDHQSLTFLKRTRFPDDNARHPGVKKTLRAIRRKYTWQGMERDVREYVSTCIKCQKNKPRCSKPPGLLQPLPIPHRPWQSISIDFVTGLPASGVSAYDSICVVVDRFSKMAHFVPLHSTVTAEQFAKLFLDRVWCLHGFPTSIVSDRDPKFVSAFWGSFCEQLGIRRLLSTSAHPQTDGQTERTIRTLTQMLRGYVGNAPEEWVSYLAVAEFAYNSAVHESTQASPFSLVYVEPPDDFPELPQSEETSLNDALQKAAARLALAKDNLVKAQEAQKKNYDRTRKHEVLQAGDLVMVSTRLLRGHSTREKKLAPRWEGPFKVLKRVNDLAYVVDFPPSMRVHRTVNIGFLRKCEVSARYPRLLPSVDEAAPSRGLAERHRRKCRSRGLDGADMHPYCIEAILESRERKKRDGTSERQFLVKWKDSELGETWENYGTLCDMLTPEDMELLKSVSAGEDAAV